VVEHICALASSHPENNGFKAKVLRVGQLMGDTQHGIWNSEEAIALMIRSAETLNALPLLTNDEKLSWLPVDIAASTVIEISLQKTTIEEQQPQHLFFNLWNHNTISHNSDLLPAVKASGVHFEAVPQKEWVEKVRRGTQDPGKNPAVKLLPYFEARFGDDAAGDVEFSTAMARRYSRTLDGAIAPDGCLIEKCVRYWRELGGKGLDG
jgi:thioester reductase-like protein